MQRKEQEKTAAVAEILCNALDSIEGILASDIQNDQNDNGNNNSINNNRNASVNGTTSSSESEVRLTQHVRLTTSTATGNSSRQDHRQDTIS